MHACPSLRAAETKVYSELRVNEKLGKGSVCVYDMCALIYFTFMAFTLFYSFLKAV